MRQSSITLLIASIILNSCVDAFSIHRENTIARRNHRVQVVSADVGERNMTARSLQKRFDGARFTFYDAGLGACGKTNSNSEFVVAINTEQYAGGSHCFESITITVGSKTHSAQIVDECEICPFAGLDFSRGLFDFFASESVGVLTGSWNFGGASQPPAPPKSTTHHDPPAPTTTHASHTSTQSKHSASASSSATTSASSVSGSATMSGSAASASATAGAESDSLSDTGNLQQLNLAYVQIAALVVAGGANGGATS